MKNLRQVPLDASFFIMETLSDAIYTDAPLINDDSNDLHGRHQYGHG